MIVSQPVPIGTKLQMHPSGERGTELRDYTVIEVYDHFAVTEDEFGIRQCILNADLIQMGLARE